MNFFDNSEILRGLSTLVAMKLLFQLRTFLGDQKPADFLTNFPDRPFILREPAMNCASLLPKTADTSRTVSTCLTEINKAFGLCYKLEFFVV
jgi:hypothetical protein